jgi:hypothetical protein
MLGLEYSSLQSSHLVSHTASGSCLGSAAGDHDEHCETVLAWLVSHFREAEVCDSTGEGGGAVGTRV